MKPIPMDESDPLIEAAPLRHVLLKSARKDEILDYSLLLASQSIKHWMEFDGSEWSLTLDERDVPLAAEIVSVYHAENRGFQDLPPTAGELDLLVSPLLYLAVPVAAYFIVGLSPWANWWYSRGSADARLILEGQWWRCITAATLHADEVHFLGNLVSGYFILNLLNHRLGMGSIMILSTLGAGITNYMVALASGARHVSIGYSSVVFCALGMLAAVETLNLQKLRDPAVIAGQGPASTGWRPGRRPVGAGTWFGGLRRLTPLISAFFVAVMVGLGENADVKAHFYGFGIGAGLGLLSRFMPRRVKRPPWQGLLVMATYGLFALAWKLALRT
ncbi:MAG: rhomboid family intramembrane serine protease [Fibrobacterota bacterium]|nr:rhomboid family intramembrane serine protease [Fibrobacterota bacterium]